MQGGEEKEGDEKSGEGEEKEGEEKEGEGEEKEVRLRHTYYTIFHGADMIS
jgi:hypothetical protein